MMFANIFEGSVSILIILSTPRYVKSFSLIFSKITILSIWHLMPHITQVMVSLFQGESAPSHIGASRRCKQGQVSSGHRHRHRRRHCSFCLQVPWGRQSVGAGTGSPSSDYVTANTTGGKFIISRHNLHKTSRSGICYTIDV